ncbi:MAG TPA: DUF6152 family protein [Gammaproteobacteria bacterium]|nr:DUF6152 family protein [Gammaproteobacteria bacterium]
MLTIVLGALLPPVGFAHHSRAYFGNDIVTITGELVGIKWRNPHVELELRATAADGRIETWQVEGNSIYNLQRRGVSREQFSVGTEVTVAGRASTRERHSLLLTSVVLPNGQTLVFEGREAPADRVDRVVDAAAENRGIFRVWSMPAADRAAIQGQMGDQPFTEAALAARASWNPLDNFALRCEPEGMPRIMINPHPFEFIDRGDRIVLRTELYDTERVIHMGADAPPGQMPPSRLGYSVGAWDEGTLVVHTTRIGWPWFDNAGTPQSPDVEIAERYTLSDDQSRLDFEITVTDPATFLRPAELRGYWLALGEEILRYDCTPLER